MSFTVVPLYNLKVAKGTSVPFAKGFVLQNVPEWLLKDETSLGDINRDDRNLVRAEQHALVAEYEADSIGMPDPEWNGEKTKSIQSLKCQSAMLANLAIWLRQPSPVRFTVCFHALSVDDREGGRVPVILLVNSHNPLYCHRNDAGNPVTTDLLKKAAELHTILAHIPRHNPVWESVRSPWIGLTMNTADHRYPFF